MSMETMFAARHGVTPQQVSGADPSIGVEQCGRLQNERSHYLMGWLAWQMMWDNEGDFVSVEQAAASGHAKYKKMVAWNVSMGRVSEREYVNGFIDAWQESKEQS